MLGPAVNSGAGLFLYGARQRQDDARQANHDVLRQLDLDSRGRSPRTASSSSCSTPPATSRSTTATTGLLNRPSTTAAGSRFAGPTVVVGGELTLDALEIRHDPVSNVSEASLQLKSNCGCLLIDDFGRQRIRPTELLNRWIIPLENRHDFLTLATGKKIQVPFEQLIIFSTNLQPTDLADEAFLRRIPYKIEVGDPSREEFQTLFKIIAKSLHCEFKPEAVDHLIEKHYKRARPPAPPLPAPRSAVSGPQLLRL